MPHAQAHPVSPRADSKVGEWARRACLTALPCWRGLRYGRESAGSELRQRGAEQAALAGVSPCNVTYMAAASAREAATISETQSGPCHIRGHGEDRGKPGTCFTLVNVPPFGSEASGSPGSAGGLCILSVGTCFPGGAHCIPPNCPGTAFLHSRGPPGHRNLRELGEEESPSARNSASAGLPRRWQCGI